MNLSPSHSIDVRVFRGVKKPKSSHADVTVEEGTVNLVRRVTGLYQDNDGMNFSKRDLPKSSNVEGPENKYAFVKNSVRLLGFVSESKVPDFIINEQLYMAGKRNCQIFNSLYKKCVEKKLVVLCSYFTTSPNLAYAVPKNGSFQFVNIPTKNDVTEIETDDLLKSKENIKSTQVGVSTQFVDTLLEYNIKDLVDPLVSVISQCYAKKTGLKSVESQVFKERSNQEAFGVLGAHG